MNWWDQYWHGPTAAVRPYLFLKGFLLILAFTAWGKMIFIGAHLIPSGFQTAHFPWMNALQPSPTPGLYIGLLLLIGLLALTMAVVGTHRLGLIALFGMHTYAWTMSRFDLYQDHYFISLMLLVLIFFPLLPRNYLPPQISAWAFRLIGVTTGLTYLWAVVAKLDHWWFQGATLQVIDATSNGFLGKTVASVLDWSVLAIGVVIIESGLVVAYLASPIVDRSKNPFTRRLFIIPWFFILAIQTGFALMGLAIGAFHQLLIFLATIFFVSEEWLGYIKKGVDTGERFLAEVSRDWLPARHFLLLLLLIAVSLAGFIIDLPGSIAAGWIASVVVLVVTLYARHAGQDMLAMRILLGGAIVTIAMVVTFFISPIRFEFYGYYGDALDHLGQSVAAQKAYKQAEYYAPADDPRLPALRARREALEASREE